MKINKKIVFSAMATVALFSTYAFAVDPTVAGTTSIGTHPSYAGYSAFWRTRGDGSSYDYSLLTEGFHTYVNAPDPNSGIIYFRHGNADMMWLQGNGLNLNVCCASKPGGGEWSSISDVRVKKDIGMFERGLADLEAVRPVTFKYNGLGGTREDNTQYVGVVAQDLEKTLPFMVSSQKKRLHPSDKDVTDIKQVDPSAFTYILINAVKELAAENREMRRIVCLDHPRESLCSKTHLASR
jgi:hypothetical protein